MVQRQVLRLRPKQEHQCGIQRSENVSLFVVTVSDGGSCSLEGKVALGLVLLNAEGLWFEDVAEKRFCLLKNEGFFASEGGASQSGSSCVAIACEGLGIQC